MDMGAIRQAFRNDGVVCLRQVLTPAWVDYMRIAADEVLAAPGPAAQNVSAKNGTGRFTYDKFMWTFNERFEHFIYASPFGRIAAQVLQAKTVHLLGDLIFSKEPHTPDRTPWHHDRPYAWYQGSQLCFFWVPLDAANLESGTLEFVRGSHRWGKSFRPKSFNPRATYDGNDDLEELPDINARRNEYDIVHFDLEAGDALLIDEMILHSAPGNDSDRPRRALSLHYGGEDATYILRPSGPKPIRDPGLVTGDSFSKSELFPKVWPQPRDLKMPAGAPQ